MGVPNMFVAMRYGGFRLLWLSTAFANSGRWAFTVVIGWLVFSLTHSTPLVGAAMFASMIPAVIFNPLVGVWADRYDRRRLLSAALLICAAANGVLGLLTALHVVTLWLVMACAFLVGIAFSVQMTSSNALLPNLVPGRFLFNAASLQGSVNQGAEFTGSALASPVLALLGASSVFALCFVLYGVAGLMSLRIECPPMEAGVGRIPARQMFRPIKEGISYIRSTAILSTLVVLVALHCSLTMAYTELLPAFADQTLAGGSATYGTLMTLIGLGAIIGTLGTASLSSKRSLGMCYVVSALVSGAALVCLGITHAVVYAFVCGLAVGASQAVFMAVSLSFMMERTGDRFRGRVSSVYSFMAAGFMAIATFAYGFAGNAIEPKFIMIATGCLFTVIFVLFIAWSKDVKCIYRGTTPRLEEQPHAIIG